MIAQRGVVSGGKLQSGVISPFETLVHWPASIFAPVWNDLVQVKGALKDLSKPLTANAASEVASCVNASGSECLNAALHLLCAGLCGYKGPSAIILGTILELISAGSKLHHKLARGDSESSRAAWAPTILAGDWAYLKAIRPAVELRNFRILDLLIEVNKKLVEGDLIESAGQKHFNHTACLFALSSRLGAVVAGCEIPQEGLLRDYGYQIGLAWDFAAGCPVDPAINEGAHTLMQEAATKAESCLEDFPDSSHKRALKSLARILRNEGNSTGVD